MDISPEQTAQYIRELQTLRNQRLDFVLSGGVQLEDIIADMMNSLEVFYVIHRSREEQAHPRDPTAGGIKSKEIQPRYEEQDS